MSQKRIRSINWDEEEKQLFRMIFKEYAQIIENKSLDTNTNRAKAKAWEQVHTKFNQLNSRPRELNQLKIQWKTMKMSARKSYSAFKKETNKTGGGARPPTPNDTIMEIKDLLNPAELLRDDNIYDSDGMVLGKVEYQTIYDTCKTDNSKLLDTDNNMEEDQITVSIHQNSKLLDTDNNMEEDQITVSIHQNSKLLDSENNMGEDQITISPYIATPSTSMATITDSILVKTTEDKAIVTPISHRGATPAKKMAIAKKNLNNIINSNKNSKMDHDDYVNSMISHSKMLKNKEHMRQMEMAEEEHKIKMEIHRENLKSAILQREILELKKRDQLLDKQ